MAAKYLALSLFVIMLLIVTDQSAVYRRQSPNITEKSTVDGISRPTTITDQHTDDLYTDRQTDRYFIDRNKSHYRLICHSNKIDICTCIYKNVSLLKLYMTIYMV